MTMPRCLSTVLILCIGSVLHVSAAAQVTYDGRDTPAGTGWRATAAAQIEQHRKADLAFTFRDTAGVALSGLDIEIAMTRHAFDFGSALDPRYFLEGRPQYDATYAQKTEELFSAAVYENHMKWKSWAEGFGPTDTLEGLDWLEQRDIKVRGHTMMWSRSQSVPTPISTILNEANPTSQQLQTLYDATFDHIADIGNATEGSIYAWDTLNESRTNSEIEDKLIGFTPAGQPAITSRSDLRARWFTYAKAQVPGALAMINDFQIIPGGGLADTEPQDYMNQIDGILAHGAPLEGIGFQSHFSDGTQDIGHKLPTGPEDVWAVLDAFDSRYGLPLHITEFDFDTADTALQADYTRDFMTAVFAHDAVEAFVLWGFWEGKINKPNAALFDADWNIKPNGQAYVDLVLDEWWTDTQAITDAQGAIALRGFKGEYGVRVIHGGVTYEFSGLDLAEPGLTAEFTLNTGTFDTRLNNPGADINVAANWNDGLPSLERTGLIDSDAIVGDRVAGRIITQTAGTVRFTHQQASRSALSDGTHWYLRGGVLRDDNSHFLLRDAMLTIDGGRLVIPSRSAKLIRGDSTLTLIGGEIEAERIQFGANNSTAGSKVVRFGLGDGVATLEHASPFDFRDDGDPENDFVDFVTGSGVHLITLADEAYFAGLWELGRLRLDGQTANETGLAFSQSDFIVRELSGGWTDLSLIDSVAAVPGDYNADGFVSQADLDLVLLNWGDVSMPLGFNEDGLVGEDGFDGLISQNELDGVLLNWGNGTSPSTAAVPEPTTCWIILVSLLTRVRKR